MKKLRDTGTTVGLHLGNQEGRLQSAHTAETLIYCEM